MQFISGKHMHIVVPPISRTFSSCKTETLDPSCNDSHPLPWAHVPLATTMLLPVSVTIQIRHISGLLQCLSFCNWLISLNVTSSMFTQVVVCDRIPSVFKAEYSPIMCVSPFCFSTYVSGHLGCFHLEKLILIVIRACLSGF